MATRSASGRTIAMMPTNRSLKAEPSGRIGFAAAALTDQSTPHPIRSRTFSRKSVRSPTLSSGYVSMQIIHRSSHRPIHTTPKVLTVTEAARLRRIGRSTAYEAANRYLAGDTDGLPVIRIGR